MDKTEILPYLVLALLLLGLYSCVQQPVEKKKVVYVNSYHRGFPPSDQITEGVFEKLPADSFEIVAYFMDTKRNPSEAYIKNRAAVILDSIHSERPDLLIVSDDNAIKYLVAPNFHNDPLPIVFCGVNWTADQYDLAHCNITGILELLPVAESLHTLKFYYPKMQKLLVLNENTTTSRKTKPLLDNLLSEIGFSVQQALVHDFEDWKSAFIEGNANFDVMYLQTRGAIKNWDHEEALKIIDQHIRIPLFTCEDFMMTYAVFGLTQVSKEQGMWAAETAKEILKGTGPEEIPISKNQMSTVWINTRLAEKIDFTPDEALLSKASIVD
ncbi:MAG: hypothetical protein HKN87_20655 [Saprospiraceae bacterium]|nr:hypothetical protein [Saprospiraceae bacterium]